MRVACLSLSTAADWLMCATAAVDTVDACLE